MKITMCLQNKGKAVMWFLNIKYSKLSGNLKLNWYQLFEDCFFCGRNILPVVHSYSRLLWPLFVAIIFYFSNSN